MKNSIQEKRMREYFITAAKEILKGEGIKALSVRNIAERAGYSYTTLYNYFKDVNELIFLCVTDFQEECNQYAESKTKNLPFGKERLSAKIKGYMGFFVEYPSIFELYFLERVGDFGNRQTIIDTIAHSLEKTSKAEWDYCIAHGLIKKEDASLVMLQLRNLVVGLLLFYINRLTPANYVDFIDQSSKMIDTFLGKKHSIAKQPQSSIPKCPYHNLPVLCLFIYVLKQTTTVN
jgi:AcrR family transcriptional regulator